MLLSSRFLLKCNASIAVDHLIILEREKKRVHLVRGEERNVDKMKCDQYFTLDI